MPKTLMIRGWERIGEGERKVEEEESERREMVKENSWRERQRERK